MIINPYRFAAPTPFGNQYSMHMANAAGAGGEILYINNKANDIDTTLRDTTPNFSISGWFKRDDADTGQDHTIFSKYQNSAGADRCFQIYANVNNLFVILGTYNGSAYSVAIAPSASTLTVTSGIGWTHFVYVYDSSKTVADEISRLYINGSLITEYSTKTISTTNKYFQNQTTEGSRANVAVGCVYNGAAISGWNGEVDEFTFWNISISASEAVELYNSGEAYDVSQMTNYANCIAWWRMGDYADDAWDGSNWTIHNVKGGSTMDLLSAGLVEADRYEDVPQS